MENIYFNAVEMLQCRGAQVVEQVARERINDIINSAEYVSARGVRGPDDIRGAANIIVVVISPTSEYAFKKPAFQKLVEKILRDISTPNAADALPSEIIFLTQDKMTSGATNYLQEVMKDNPNVRIEKYLHEIFQTNVTKHSMVSPHTIATQKEIDEYCARFKTLPRYFPRILQTDPQVVWLGARPQMCIKIIRDSETAMTAAVYRLVVASKE